MSDYGIIRTFNSAAEDLLGFNADEVIGSRSPIDFHEPDEVAARARVISDELGRLVDNGFDVLAAKARLGLPEVLFD
ncbi:MAG: PAS domain S-box protein [Myxococcales bacterium]|nr:PAS domain S-box protein [Myxococcales bacterium]